MNPSQWNQNKHEVSLQIKSYVAMKSPNKDEKTYFSSSHRGHKNKILQI